MVRRRLRRSAGRGRGRRARQRTGRLRLAGIRRRRRLGRGRADDGAGQRGRHRRSSPGSVRRRRPANMARRSATVRRTAATVAAQGAVTSPGRVSYADAELSVAGFTTAVTAAAARIRAGELQKVVLAHDLRGDDRHGRSTSASCCGRLAGRLPGLLDVRRRGPGRRQPGTADPADRPGHRLPGAGRDRLEGAQRRRGVRGPAGQRQGHRRTRLRGAVGGRGAGPGDASTWMCRPRRCRWSWRT